jgi:hypothetical protein
MPQKAGSAERNLRSTTDVSNSEGQSRTNSYTIPLSPRRAPKLQRAQVATDRRRQVRSPILF